MNRLGSDLLAAAVAGCVALAVACGRPPRAPGDAGSSVRPGGCELVPGEPDGSVLDVAAPGSIDPRRAPVPASPAERVAFRHLYETLLRVDCAGRPSAGLAAAWVAADGGRAWRLTLRPGAAFWDGTPVRAADVVTSWAAPFGPLPPGSPPPSRPSGPSAGVGPRSPPSGNPEPLWPEAVERPDRALLRVRVARSAEALDERTLLVRLDAPAAGPPAWLADPALAVHRPAAGGGWPEGTGPLRVHRGAGVPGPPPLVVYPVSRGPRDPRAVLRFHPTPGDPRERLDVGVDLLLTDDPAALTYAGTLAGYEVVPLPWERTYALLGGPPAEPEGVGSAPRERALREALARDAVRAAARAAEGSPPTPPGICPLAPAGAGGEPDAAPPPRRSAAARSARILHPAGDPAARELAERLAALAPVGDPELPGWVASLPRAAGAADPKTLRSALVAGAPVVAALPGPAGVCARAAGAGAPVVRPLVDARRHAVLRRSLGGIAVEGDGTLLLSGAGRRGAAGTGR